MITAIVLAGGSGKRFGGEIPKQYMPLCQKPVLAWSLSAFEESRADEIILVCSEKDADYCLKEIIEKYGISKCAAIAVGGENRYDSVYSGLKAAAKRRGKANAETEGDSDKTDFCLIHDGARPCIAVETINAAIEYVTTKGSCVVGVPATDTVQVADENGNISFTPDRKRTWLAQTPQCFELNNALNSYRAAIENKDTSITDDASAVLKYGTGSIYMLEGKAENIKITTAADLKKAADILSLRNKGTAGSRLSLC